MVNKNVQHHWFEKYPQLDYNAEEDPMTCVLCERQNSNLLPLWYKKETFLKTGYKNWKKTTEKFDKHHLSKCHECALIFEVIVPQSRNVFEMIDQNEKKRGKFKRRIFLTILETAVFATSKVGYVRRWWWWI